MDEKRNSIEQIINKFSNEINQDNDNQPIIKSLIFLSRKSSYCRSYPEISDIIYHLDDKSFNKLKENFALSDKNTENKYDAIINGEEISAEAENNPERLNNLHKFERHIRLSCYQRDYILGQAKSASDTATHAQLAADNAKNKVGHIYSEFVGILAIFTAMSFAMMGSVQILGNLFSSIKTLGIDSVGYALIIGGIYIIVMYFVIVILFVGMKKLYGDSTKYSFSKQIIVAVLSVSVLLIASGIILLIVV